MKAADFASFVENRSAWVTDAGTYNIKVGASSTDIKLNADIEISDEIVRKVKVMFPQVSLE
jgi:beta-glucosidase